MGFIRAGATGGGGVSRTFQFFADSLNAEKAEAVVAGAEHAHLRRVLRLRPGDRILVSDGESLYHAVIAESDDVRTVARLERPVSRAAESPLAMTLIQALPKGKKWEWILQKATELGVRRIVPVVSERSVPRFSGERAARKRERWKQILKEAAKQSYRSTIPELLEVTPLDKALGMNDASLKLVCAPDAERGLKACLNEGDATRGVTVAIGPEGGFSPAEIQRACSRGFVPCHLGARTLRLETAVIKVLSILQYVLGDG